MRFNRAYLASILAVLCLFTGFAAVLHTASTPQAVAIITAIPAILAMTLEAGWAIAAKMAPGEVLAARNDEAAQSLRVWSQLFLLIAQAIIAAAPGLAPYGVVSIAVGALFLGLGNFLPCIAPNRNFGIRTPWTLSNPVIWLRTHRRAGWTMVVCGLALMLAGNFVNSSSIQKTFSVTAVAAVVIAILSTAKTKA